MESSIVAPQQHRGRQKGTPNKDKDALVEKIQAAVVKLGGPPGWDAVEEMAKDAVRSPDAKIRQQCLSEVAQYTHPKRRAIEHSGEIAVVHENWLDDMNDDILAK